MNICPNKNTKEWKALVEAVGEFEAMKDFMETEGEIRTPKEVKEKLEYGTTQEYIKSHGLPESSVEVPAGSPEVNSLVGNALINNPQHELDYSSTDNTKAFEIATKMSEQLGVDFDVITHEEAYSLTKDAGTPWSGERAFFIGGKVYFVVNELTTGMAFHEFSHPLIRTISKENNTLFNNLFNKLRATEEGTSIIASVQENYPELDIESDYFKEEVIVQALTKAGEQKLDGLATPTGFAKVIKDIMYAMKQMLRKVFGQKVQVSKLAPSTTLDELGEMLVKGEQFEIDTTQINEEDVAAYSRDQRQDIEDAINAPNKEIQALVNNAFDLAGVHINTMLNKEEYDELASLLTDPDNLGELQLLRGSVSKYQTTIAEMATKVKDSLEHDKERATSLVNMLYRLETVMAKMEAHMKDLSKREDTIDNMNKAYYYKHIVDGWQHFIKEAKKGLKDVPHDSPLIKVVNNSGQLIERIQDMASEMAAKGSRDTLYAELEPMGRAIKNRYDEIIGKLRDRNAPQKTIDKWHKQYYGITEARQAELKAYENARASGRLLTGAETEIYNKLKDEANTGIQITPEKIESLLKGEAGDANFFNAYFEGYLYSADPIIGGLALHVKNKMNEVMSRVQAKQNDFAREMEPLLKEAGYSYSRMGGLGEKVGFEDTVGKVSKEGFEERKVWSLIGRFKNYRHDKHKLEHAKGEAHRIYSETGSDVDRAALIQSVGDLKEFERKYMNQRYTSEYYELENLFERDDIGKDAGYRRENLFERMKNLTEPAKSESDLLEISDQLDALWKEYREMYSWHYPDGAVKGAQGTQKDLYELSITERLREHRDESRKYHDWDERAGAFETALRAYEQDLVDQDHAPGSIQYNIYRAEWLARNTRVAIKPDFYEYRQSLIDQIAKILSTLPDNEAKNLATGEIWSQIIDLSSAVRDIDGQPDASQLSEESISKVKDLQEQLEKKKEEFEKYSGLSPQQAARLEELKKAKDLKVGSTKLGLTSEEKAEMAALYSTMKLNMAQLGGLFQSLRDLAHKEATDYYADQMNNYLERMNTDVMHQAMGDRMITKDNADQILRNDVINDLTEQDEDFAKWFRENHIQREVYNSKSETYESTWERLYVWNVTRPNSEEYMETTTILDENGKEEKIMGLPTMKYYTRKVKPEFRTKEIIGVTVDNRGRWLPKTIDQGAADDKYINEKYDNLRKTDPKMFAILEKLTEHHLENQKGLSNKSKLYLEFPRFRKSGLEVVQTKKDIVKEKWSALTIYAKRVKEFWTGAKDDAESGFNYDDEFNLVRMDLFDNEVTDVPIAGLYDVDPLDVSTDIMNSMMRYMLSAERQKQLIEISPFARAVKDAVNHPDNKLKEMDKVNKFNFINRGIMTYKNKKGFSVRQKTVNAFIEREFEGQTMAGFTKDIPWLNNIAGKLFSRSSFSFFALNIPSALKNSFGAKFQGMIEASAGTYLNHGTFAKGEAWSLKAMSEISAQVYKRGPKSLNVQLIELMDPSQGRFEDKVGESLSRNITKDAVSFSWLYSFRKWVELEATHQIFGGMMYHQKVERIHEDGTKEEITYMDAWELKDGKIQLKEGVDPRWGVTYDSDGKQQVGADFKMFRNRTHQVMNNLQGSYAKFDQPEAQRYIAFRFLSYLRRYFTSMAVNRWGYSGRFFDARPRLNPGLGDVHQGYYITFLTTLKETLLRLGRNLPYMAREEKKAALKVITEVGALAVTGMAMGLLFGWDPDDDQRFAKLRERSGALPFPFVEEDPNRPFDGWGFMENHALLLLMNIRAENEQFLPFPGYGLDDYTALLDIKSVAFGPTTDTYSKLIDDGVDIITGDESAYYKREVGPYQWQHEGGAKIFAHLGVALGFTGSSVDPSKAVKGLAITSRAK